MATDTPERFREEISTVVAGQKYRLTPSYVARLARTHVIRARKFGRDWIVDEEALREYLAQPRKTGPKPQRKGHVKKDEVQMLDGSDAVKGELHAATQEHGGRKPLS